MKRISLFLFSLVFAAPLFAANRFFDLNGFATWVDPQSSNTFNSTNPNRPFKISFSGKLGYGVGANVFFGDRISAEFAASEVRPTAQYGFAQVGAPLSEGRLKMIPITAVLQYHLSPNGFIDPYIGAGAAYVLFDNLSNANDVGRIGVRRIDFKDDVGLALNGGVSLRLTPSFAVFVDGKYVPLKSSATAVFVTGPSTEQRIKINPVMASAGVSLRF